MASSEKSAVPSPDSTPPHGEVERLLAELREANERLVLAGVQLQELSEQAETGQRQADAARVDAEMAAEQLRIALEAGRMGTWQYTMSTGAVRWSPGLEAIHGYAPGSFAGTLEAFRKEIHPADRDRVLEAIGAAVEQRRDHHIEYRIVRSDGTERWVEGRGQLFCDREGQPERMVGVCLDVTERKHAEEKFRLAVEAAPAAMIMADPRGTIVLVNTLAEQLLGYAQHEIVGQPLDRLVPPRFRDRHQEYRKTFFADPRQRPMGAGRELYALRKDGSEVPVEIGLSPVDTADGRFAMAAVTDITERKRTAAALEDAVRARDDFLAMASHELRNPINALQLQLVGVLREAGRYSESLPREWVSQRVGQARNQVARLERLVGNLLDVTRIRAGRLDLELEDLDFGSVVQATVDRFRNELKDLDVTLRLTPVIGRSDKLRLDQIVTNLLRNAVNPDVTKKLRRPCTLKLKKARRCG